MATLDVRPQAACARTRCWMEPLTQDRRPASSFLALLLATAPDFITAHVAIPETYFLVLTGNDGNPRHRRRGVPHPPTRPDHSTHRVDRSDVIQVESGVCVDQPHIASSVTVIGARRQDHDAVPMRAGRLAPSSRTFATLVSVSNSEAQQCPTASSAQLVQIQAKRLTKPRTSSTAEQDRQPQQHSSCCC